MLCLGSIPGFQSQGLVFASVLPSCSFLIAASWSQPHPWTTSRSRCQHRRIEQVARVNHIASKCIQAKESEVDPGNRSGVNVISTTAHALLQHVRDRWSIENSGDWPLDTQLLEDHHRYREFNGMRILATLRSLAMNALRLGDFWSITEGMAALAHNTKSLIRMLGWRELAAAKPSHGLLISPRCVVPAGCSADKGV